MVFTRIFMIKCIAIPIFFVSFNFKKGLPSIEDSNDIQDGAFHIIVLDDHMEKNSTVRGHERSLSYAMPS